MELVSLFTDADPWDEPVLKYARQHSHVRVADILEHPLGIDVERQGRRDQYRVTAILRRAGFEPQQIRVGLEKQRVWVNPRRPMTGTDGAAR
jgi:hypothetical protein